MKLDKSVRHILLYGLALASLIFMLKYLQWKFLIVDNAIEIYIGLIAIIFTIFGIWVASQLIKPKTQTVLVEKEVTIQEDQKFIANQTELERLNLTNREYQILTLLATGLSNADIANDLFLSISTIKTHVSNLYSKMNVKNRVQAINKAKNLKIVE